MRRRRRRDEDVDSIVVITEDGTRLRCTISAIGRSEAPRWVVMDSDANQYIGPLVESERSPDAVQKLISSWWATHPKDTVGR
jgi:hypothetical protein